MKMLLLTFSLMFFSAGAFAIAQESISKAFPRIVILLGPPGSGKGTQAVRLTKELSIPHISTGDLFRENISKNTDLGQRAKGFMDAGKLVPDELVLEMLFDRVSRPDCTNGYLLDGFPRTLPQAEAFEKQLKPGTELVVLDLEVPDEVIVKRAEGRLTCKSCASIYNRYFSPPKEEGICDKCKGELIQRSDDKAEVVQERLRTYHNQTKPLVEYYSKKGVLHRFDGTQQPTEVFNQIMTVLKQQKQLEIKALDFENHQPIPPKYTCQGLNHSPALVITGTPDGTKSFALIVDDPDAPNGTFDHWIVWNIPANTEQLSEGIQIGNQGKNSYGELNYRGPCPPPGKVHRYFFKLYALDSLLQLPEGSFKQEVENAMNSHIIGKTELVGTFKR